jgi:anti-sigma regulatory factor (Ser/Thr protein kinase)
VREPQWDPGCRPEDASAQAAAPTKQSGAPDAAKDASGKGVRALDRRGNPLGRRRPSPGQVAFELAALAHDFRSPLAAVQQQVALFRQGLLGPLTDRQRLALEGVLRRCDELERLIDNILDLARSETGHLRPHLDEVHLDDVVPPCLERLSLAAQHQHVRFHLAGLDQVGPVFADPDMLSRVLTNLLSNALKASPPGSTVTLRADQPSLAYVTVAVEDQGPGLNTVEVRRLLRAFHQGAEARLRGSGGLGLAIVRRLLRIQGGSLSIRTVPGQGTSFQITLRRFLPKAILRRFLASSRPKPWAALAVLGISASKLRAAHRFVTSSLRPGELALPHRPNGSILLAAVGKAASVRLNRLGMDLSLFLREPIRFLWLSHADMLRWPELPTDSSAAPENTPTARAS